MSDYYWMAMTRCVLTKTGRNESQDPNAQASGDRSPSMAKENAEVPSLPTPGVDVNSNFLSQVTENHRRTFEKVSQANFPMNTATRCVWTRNCMWALLISKAIETYIKGYQNFSIKNTQDTLNILLSSLKMSKTNESSIVRDGAEFSSESLLDDKRIFFTKSRLDACASPQCMSSQSQFSVQAQGSLDPPSGFNLWRRKQKKVWKSNYCKNGNDIRW